MEFIELVLSTSSVHGLGHIAAKRHPLERLVWVLAVFSGYCGAFSLCLSTWHRYQSSPTVISMEKNYIEWNTTFPAATFCPVSRIDSTEAETVAQQLFPNLDGSEAMLRLESLTNASYQTFEDILELGHLNPDSYLSTYIDVKFNFSYALSNSNSEPISFVETMTEMGYCYTYNSICAIYNNPLYWSEEKLTISDPTQLFKGSPLDGDIFAQVLDMNTAVKAYIHGPEDLPESSSRWYYSDVKHYTTLDMVAMSIYSTEATRSLSVKQRKCRFMEESNLETSPVYSYNMCRSECRMRLAHRLCACIPYFYRKTKKYKICNSNGMKCLAKHKDRMLKLRLADGTKEKCDCYPSCNDNNYVTQDESSVDWFIATNFKYGLVKYPRSRLKRDVVFGVGDLLVQFGGTFGLCLGCSLLTIVEFVYFFTLRLVIFVWKKSHSNEK